MELRLFDTYSREIRVFIPIEKGKVGLYACGPTVYDFAHIGNLRTYIFEDILRRVLQFNGYQVEHVVNITDVGHLVSDADTGEDKMVKASERTGKSAWEIAELYTDYFRQDLKKLNILEPTIWCKATNHIKEQIELIQCIVDKGYTYQTSDGLYFDTSKLKDYGYLARLNIEGLQAGTRIDMGEKRNITDFALWKFSPPGQKRQMEWESSWGTGFPGWHIECSAMSAKYLGNLFDIHCGGEDHIPVHHTNEIAQAEACFKTRLANFWMHGYFLQIDSERMSKSSGEFLRLQTLIERGYDPLTYRFFCLNAHYRSKLNFSWDGLNGAEISLNRLRSSFYDLNNPGEVDQSFLDSFITQINDDLNMPRALAITWELLKSDIPSENKRATLIEFDKVLGLDLENWYPKDEIIPDEIMILVQQRQEARISKKWDIADEIRKRIINAGFEVEDTPSGSKVRSKKGEHNL